MTCSQCGCELELTQNSGGITKGSFVERYQCVGCGATGSIRGESSDPPQHWKKTGRTFNDY